MNEQVINKVSCVARVGVEMKNGLTIRSDIFEIIAEVCKMRRPG